ncbi:MAG: hypothetical protein R3250_12515, partial [Melioribacteraceae bacterium]|nr:hypothetical protein [Melioribacteraceae bacterium]
DAENITSGFGVATFKTPIATFDLDDNYFGFDSTGINGVKYYLGDNSGLQHSYVDTTVKNGFTYYYAVVSYDFGYPQGDILPTESPIKISLQSDGTVVTGSNVVKITPEAPTAGYVAPTLGTIDLVEGATTSVVSYRILDETLVKDQHTYTITFEDTLKVGESGESDTLTTKNFTLTDETAGVVLIDKSTVFGEDDEQPIIDGFQLTFRNEEKVEIDEANSGWNNDGIMDFTFEKLVTPQESGEQRPNDYIISFGEVGIGTSSEITLSNNTFPAQDVNFQIFNVSSGQFIKFGFIDLETADGEGLLSASGARRDRVVFLEEDQSGVEKKTWWFYLSGSAPNEERFPTSGDSVYLNLKKPFLAADKFSFTTSSGKTDLALAKKDMDNIKVVPNPYVASAKWELKNPFNTGRGPRSLHFTNLPQKCTIRVFTINGELVNTLEHDSNLNNGTYDWDMLTKDRLAISYGVYVFHVEAPGIGDKIGKFAVIK